MLFLLLSFNIDLPFRFLIYLSIYIYIYIYILYILLFCFFVLFFFLSVYIGMQKKRLHLESPSCKVLYDIIKIDGHIEVVSIHIGQNQGSSREGPLHHIGALKGRGKLSSMIRHGLVVLFQDQVSFFKDSGSNFLVECSLNEVLVQLSTALHCHALLVYHVQLLISGICLFNLQTKIGHFPLDSFCKQSYEGYPTLGWDVHSNLALSSPHRF